MVLTVTHTLARTHLPTGLTLVIHASVDLLNWERSSLGIGAEECHELGQVRMTRILFQVARNAKFVLMRGPRHIPCRLIQVAQARRRYCVRAAGWDRRLDAQCCQWILQLQVAVDKSWPIWRQSRESPKSTWRAKIRRRCDGLHMPVRGSGERITSCAKDSLLRLCMAVDLV